jgi:hypothetical protein
LSEALFGQWTGLGIIVVVVAFTIQYGEFIATGTRPAAIFSKTTGLERLGHGGSDSFRPSDHLIERGEPRRSPRPKEQAGLHARPAWRLDERAT